MKYLFTIFDKNTTCIQIFCTFPLLNERDGRDGRDGRAKAGPYPESGKQGEEVKA